MRTQRCPNCQTVADVTVFVTGQRIRCASCGIHFEVRRSDASVIVQKVAGGAPTTVPRGETPPPEGVAVAVEVEATQLRVIQGGQPQDSGVQVTQVRTDKPDIPGFELLEVLGRGGMGEVWRARQISLDRTVAIKLLPERLSQNPEFIARFQKEATALASLSHPNIVQIIDRGVAGGHYYFVMEYVQGRSLRDVMNGVALPTAQALQITYQLCRAIDYAHEQKIIHRDLKPENVLVDDHGNVKVADFGLAGIQAPDQHLTATAVAMGTVNYMAPEQRRDAKNVDGRADLYSLGVILYEMLTGELPVGRFKLPSERTNGVDARLDPIVAQALEPDPQARQARASEINDHLIPLLSELGVKRRPSSSPATSLATPAPAQATPAPLAQAAPASQLFRRQLGAKAKGAIALAVLAGILVFMRLTGREVHVEHGQGELALQYHHHVKGDPADPAAKGALPPNTDAALPAHSRFTSEGGRVLLALQFKQAPDGTPVEPIHAHAGSWSLDQGALVATQAGDEAEGGVLIPRAYVDDRFFTSDDFDARVQMQLTPLESGYPVRPNAPTFAELAFRLDDAQVSIFADPKKGMQLSWRYVRGEQDVVGSTEHDVQLHVADETFVPSQGPFTVRLKLHRDAEGDDTEVEAFLDGQRFAKKTLKGFHHELGKVALGCRDLHCRFTALSVRGEALTPAQQAQVQSRKDHGER